MKLAFLGPMGTFCNEAAKYVSNNDELIPYPSIYHVLEAVNKGEAQSGIVPVENSTEGSVNLTIDTIIFETDLYIQKEIILPISQCLIARNNCDITKVNKIYSHPQALAQCRYYLREHFPDAELISTNSTASAVETISRLNENAMAIGIKLASDFYNLNCIEEDIQDSKTNYTRFILVSKKSTAKPVENTKVTLAFSTLNKPGELYKILDIFSIWDVNMTQIISRPYHNKTGEYVFYVDLDCNNVLDMEDTLKMLERKTTFLKILGSYSIEDLRK